MTTQKPTLVHVIAWTTLASGIVNLFWGFIASGTALATIFGVICIPITILPTVLGVFELIYAAKLFSQPPQVLKPSTNIAILEIANALSLNFFSVAVGILSLVFYNDSAVKAYFASLNGTLPAMSPPQPAPVSPYQPEETPADVAPKAEEEAPSKPKRTPRQAAKK